MIDFLKSLILKTVNGTADREFFQRLHLLRVRHISIEFQNTLDALRGSVLEVDLIPNTSPGQVILKTSESKSFNML